MRRIIINEQNLKRCPYCKCFTLNVYGNADTFGYASYGNSFIWSCHTCNVRFIELKGGRKKTK